VGGVSLKKTRKIKVFWCRGKKYFFKALPQRSFWPQSQKDSAPTGQ